MKTISSRNWDFRAARHLLNRAGFGVPRERAAELAAMDPEQAVAALVDYESQPESGARPDYLIPQTKALEIRRGAKAAASPVERQRLVKELNQQERAAVEALKAWWFRRMFTTQRPLEEKLTLFWHGHFATSAQKVNSSEANYDLNEILRRNAAGNAKTLTRLAGYSPAMLVYLDNYRNVKGDPNENWARELMELFTIGPGHYTEDDIKESARAFTGWGISPKGKGGRAGKDRHDDGVKQFMGRTGNFTGDDIIDAIFEQDATAEFICAKLWTYFAGTGPDREVLGEMSSVMRANAYEIRPVLKAMFLSKAFYADDVICAQIKGPAQFLVQLAADLRLDPVPYDQMARLSAALGQNLFYPPNVKGWDGGRAWINANTLLMRYNMPKALVVAADRRDDAANDESMMPAMKPNKEQYRERVKEFMREIPKDERQALREKLQNADTKEARAAVFNRTVGTEIFENRWDAGALLQGLDFDSVESCVDALEARFLNAPFDSRQRQLIGQTLKLADADRSAPSEVSISREAIVPVLHLLFSSAEYQLC